jgi:elongation factor P hydroxylase
VAGSVALCGCRLNSEEWYLTGPAAVRIGTIHVTSKIFYYSDIHELCHIIVKKAREQLSLTDFAALCL